MGRQGAPGGLFQGMGSQPTPQPATMITCRCSHARERTAVGGAIASAGRRQSGALPSPAAHPSEAAVPPVKHVAIRNLGLRWLPKL